MDIPVRQSRARPVMPARAVKLTFRDIYDAQAIARFVPPVTDRNVHPALALCNAGVDPAGPAHPNPSGGLPRPRAPPARSDPHPARTLRPEGEARRAGPLTCEYTVAPWCALDGLEESAILAPDRAAATLPGSGSPRPATRRVRHAHAGRKQPPAVWLPQACSTMAG